MKIASIINISSLFALVEGYLNLSFGGLSFLSLRALLGARPLLRLAHN